MLNHALSHSFKRMVKIKLFMVLFLKYMLNIFYQKKYILNILSFAFYMCEFNYLQIKLQTLCQAILGGLLDWIIKLKYIMYNEGILDDAYELQPKK